MPKKKLLMFSILLVFLFLLSLIPVPELRAQDTLPFGGRIKAVFYCCNGITIAVGPPKGGTFLFTNGSILHAYYNIYAPGPWVLGSASAGGFCEVPINVPPFCDPVAVDGTIIRVGTSDL